MTDKEIIKALESEIHLVEYADSSYADNVSLVLLKNALDIINKQQAQLRSAKASGEIAAEAIKRQDKEIERLNIENKILSKNADTAFQDGLNESQDLYAKQIKNEVRAEAIKEFADSFDDELAKLRDTYFERGLKDYSLVCEVIHDYLYRTLKEMVGAIE